MTIVDFVPLVRVNLHVPLDEMDFLCKGSEAVISVTFILMDVELQYHSLGQVTPSQ